MIIRHEINIEDATITVTNNGRVQLDTTQYVNPIYYFETVAKVASGTLSVSLQRVSGGTNDATNSVTATSYTRQRSTAFTPPAGQTEYKVVLSGGTTPSVKSVRIIIIDNPTTLTSSEEQIEIGNNETGKTSTIEAALTNAKYWTYTAANWNGAKTFYAEVTYLVASSKSSGSFFIQEDNGSFASWTHTWASGSNGTIVNAGIATVATRVRSAALVPTDGRHYRIAYLVASSKSAASIFNAKIIVDQTSIPLFISSTNNSATSGNITLTLPAGWVINDILILTVSSKDNVASTFPSGWTILNETNDTSALRVTVVWKRAVSGETNPLVTHSAGGAIIGSLVALRGLTGAGGINSPFSVIGTPSSNASSTTVTANGITPTSGDLVLFIGGINTTGIGTPTYNVTNPTLTGFVAILSGTGVGEILGSGISAGGATVTNTATISTGGVNVGQIVSMTPASSSITLLESQYLLLNTADSNVTGLQTFQTLIDKTNEWSGVTIVGKHQIESDNASNSAKLQDIDNANADITSSTVTGANIQLSADIWANFTDGHQVDVNIINTTGINSASRVIAYVTVTAVSTALRLQHLLLLGVG